MKRIEFLRQKVFNLLRPITRRSINVLFESS